MVIFSEATTHGTLPWQGKHQRRTLAYRFSPGTMNFHGMVHDFSTPAYIQEMSDAQQGVMEPAYGRLHTWHNASERK